MAPGPDPPLLGLRKPGDKARLHRRFDRMGRLVGDEGMDRLASGHAMVVGLGGVGSWAAEALVRAGVGRVSLIDFDLVCVTNGNRQLHALRGTTGRPKVDVMAERLTAIHPACRIDAIRRFYSAEHADEIFAHVEDGAAFVLVDAIDNLTAKAHLIATARARGRWLVVSGGAAGRLDPTRIRVGDLAQVRGDAFLAATRKLLRKQHGFPAQGAWSLPAVHSLEPARPPRPLAYDGDEGFVCVCPQGGNGLHTCEHRNVIWGTAGYVTGAFGLACAAAAVEQLLNGPGDGRSGQ